MKQYRLIILGTTFIIIILLAAVFAPVITQYDPNQMSLANRFAAPTGTHLFGLDQNGCDVFSKVIYGARLSLFVSLIVVFFGASLGLVVGSLAGFKGGWTDQLIMRLIDMIYAFPGFLLALALVAVMGPSIRNLILAMCLTSWTGFARLIRGEVLHLKEKEYVLAARALGASPLRLLTFHIWPNLLGPLIVQMTFAMAGTVLAESSLSFLGLGAPSDVPSWGALLNSGRSLLLEAPHISIFPGLAILILVLGFNLFGDGLRDLLDPKK